MKGKDIALKILMKMEKTDFGGSTSTALRFAIANLQGNVEQANEIAHELEILDAELGILDAYCKEESEEE